MELAYPDLVPTDVSRRIQERKSLSSFWNNISGDTPMTLGLDILVEG
jgi:hypothetical protein